MEISTITKMNTTPAIPKALKDSVFKVYTWEKVTNKII